MGLDVVFSRDGDRDGGKFRCRCSRRYRHINTRTVQKVHSKFSPLFDRSQLADDTTRKALTTDSTLAEGAVKKNRNH
jgi:hypothetical protein